MDKNKLAKIQDFLNNLGQEETPDEGYYSATQWAEILKVPRKTFMNKLDKLRSMNSQNIEIKKYAIKCKGGIRKIPHYKIKPS